MSTFRARLKPPKRTLWLGCIVSSVEMKRAKLNGRPYVLVRFANAPFIATWSEYMHNAFLRVCEEREVPEPASEIREGMYLNVDVKWELDPYPRSKKYEGALYPRPMIDFDSVLRSNGV